MRRLAAVLGIAALTVSSCANTDSWVQAHPATGWAAQYADAANTSYSPVDGAQALTPDWERSVKGELGAQVALGSGSYLAVNAQTADGCSLMVWETDNNARQRWCTRLWQGGPRSSALFDGFDNLYVGQPGAIMSYPPTQWIRWRQPVIGMPTTPRLLAPGQLLVLTHLGQVLVFDAHRGTVVGTSLDLVSGVDPTDSERGLGDCAAARHGLPRLGRTGLRRRVRDAGARVVGTGRAGPGSHRAAVPTRPDPDPEPGVDQRRGRRGPHRQPGAVRRRRHRLRQRARRPAVGAQHRRRHRRNGRSSWATSRRPRHRCHRTA